MYVIYIQKLRAKLLLPVKTDKIYIHSTTVLPNESKSKLKPQNDEL